MNIKTWLNSQPIPDRELQELEWLKRFHPDQIKSIDQLDFDIEESGETLVIVNPLQEMFRWD
jgi:hypothetical protein